jgi:hypothetical protein
MHRKRYLAPKRRGHAERKKEKERKNQYLSRSILKITTAFDVILKTTISPKKGNSGLVRKVKPVIFMG